MSDSFPLERFQESPVEIQEYILSARTELLPSLRQSSRLMSELTSRSYLTKLCQQPISSEEIRNYLSSTPYLFSIYYDDVNEIKDNTINYPFIMISSIYIYDPPSSYKRIISIGRYFLDKIQISGLVPSIGNMSALAFNYNEVANEILDPLSQYRIYSKRLGCMNISLQRMKSDYAKARVLEQFDIFINSFDETKILDQFRIYIYLTGLVYIYNLNFEVSSPIFINIPKNKKSTFSFEEKEMFIRNNWSYQHMVRKIPKIISEIRRYISNF